ncbi:MAG: Transcriptional regulator, AbrB family [Candidatus Saccharibacteria bacterium GW2011_GWC2_48_9]|nr:MAG: Transcriptional regulator, AbrB family [Candidatus Saccharibacteria bacterium GW2011_GWC2_48_9]HCH34375.1 AbrB family transcriptional regulator [Candidatus Saccharibacteria bacterium]
MVGKFKFWGSATVGTKGQIVIPSEARQALDMKEGDKLLIVSSAHSETLVVVKPDVLEQHMQRVQTNIKDLLDEDIK